jgi:hypothetical protein
VPVNIDLCSQLRLPVDFPASSPISSIGSVESLTGTEIEVRQFQDQRETMKFARHFMLCMLEALFSFIDLVLDNPLHSGGTDWDKIRNLAGASLTSSKR